MLRKFGALLGSSAVAVLAIAPPLSASVPKVVPSGSVTCGLNGKVTFAKALPNPQSNGSTRNVHIKISAVMTNCTGAAPVTGGKVTIAGFLEPGASCNDISDGSAPDFTFDQNKIEAKWTGVAGANTKASLGKSTTDISSTGDIVFGAWQYDTDAFGPTDAFANESAVIDIAPDAVSSAMIRSCTLGLNDSTGKPVNLTTVTFTAAAGSFISVAP